MSDIEPFELQFAPQKLMQSINPWFANSVGDQFGLFNIDLGNGDPEIERRILKRVGSYGKQIGHLGEALEVVIQLLQQIDPARFDALSSAKRAALHEFVDDVRNIRKVKNRRNGGTAETKRKRPQSPARRSQAPSTARSPEVEARRGSTGAAAL